MKFIYSYAFAAAAALASTGVQGCNGAVATTPATADSGADSSASGLKTYVYDFSKMEVAPSQFVGGIEFGGGVNFAVALDFSAQYTLIDRYELWPYPKAVGGREPGTCGASSGPDIGNLVTNATKVGPGTSAWVETLDVEILAPKLQIGLTDRLEAGICFGYRKAGGEWKFDFTEIPIKADPTTERFKVRLPIRSGPIDAVKLVMRSFDAGLLQKITLTARPTTP